MPRAVISEAAQRDMDDEGDYLARRDPDVAHHFGQATRETIDFLLEFPGLGSPCEFDNPQLADLRMKPVRGFERIIIFYRAIEDGIDIVRVLHSARDIERLFGSSDE